jgi:hypothetical protein
MNNLKQYAGLLNDAAPEDHFLAYITPGERDMLVEAGGKKTPTESGIFAYPPGYGGGGYQGGNNASDNATGGQGGSSGTGTDGQGSTGGGGDTPSPGDTGGEGGNNPQDSSTSQFSGSGGVDVGFQNALRTQEIEKAQAEQKAKDQFDYEAEAIGVGKIESNFYNDETGEFALTQTGGVIPAVDYQTSNIGAYLDNPNVPDKDKTDFLGRLKAISNSDLVGTNVDGIEDQFVVDNLDGSLNSILDQTKYSKYTNNIDEVAKTFESDFKNTPLSTVAKSGGVLGTFFRGVTDNYKNNKAMDLLGYTGSTIKYNPDGSGDFNYGGGFLTGNASQGERDAVNQLTPFAADAIGGTTNQPSMVNQYFSNMGSNLGVSSAYMDTYNAAKNKIANTLNLQPNNQQYGYGNTFNDTYARSMTSANPFFDELTNQGLI